MFYAMGSLLFAVSMMAAFAVMAHDFSRYGRAMMTALRGLSLEGFSGSEPARGSQPARSVSCPQPARTWQAAA